MSELPQGWADAKLGDVCLVFESRDPGWNPDAEFTYVDIGAIDNKTQTIAAPKRMLGADAPSRARRVIKADDVLFSTVRTYLKNIAMVPQELDGAFTSTGIAVLRAGDGVEPRYLFNWVTSDEFITEISKSQDGTLYPAVTDKDVFEAGIRLAPVPEQRRIVAKVDGLTARTARARKELDRIPTLIARYKQRLLALALCGGLTTDWRNRNDSENWLSKGMEHLAKRRAAYEKSKRGSRLRPSPPLAAGEDTGLPSSWISCCVADVADLRVGYAFKSQWFSSEGTRLIRGANVAPGRIDWSDERRLSQEHVSTYEDYVLEAGDVVIAMDRPLISTGLKIAIVAEEDAGALLVQRVANPRPTEWLNPKYMYYVFNGQGFISQIESHATGSDLPHISGNDILTTAVPLPPPEEQAEIVRRIESAFGWLDRMAADHAAAARLLSKLDAAVLAKAFRGELVPQDPNDEPASVLLEQLELRRQSLGDATKGRRGRKLKGSKALGMAEKPLTARDRLLKDSEKWPAVGLPFEAIAMRNAMPHDALRDALFELLSGPSPALQQRFDTDAEVMVIQRVAA